MKKKIILATIGLIIIFLDQISKFLLIEKSLEIIPGILSFIYTENTGVAFGLIDNNLVFVILFSVVILGIIIKFLKENRENIDFKMLISLILILSGGIGNLIDRIFRGHVIDFIKIHLFNFPTFNFADISVTIGIFILIYIIIKEMIINRNSNEQNV